MEASNKAVDQGEQDRYGLSKLAVSLATVMNITTGNSNDLETEVVDKKPNALSDKQPNASCGSDDTNKLNKFKNLRIFKEFLVAKKSSLIHKLRSEAGDGNNSHSTSTFEEVWKKRGKEAGDQRQSLQHFLDLPFIPWGTLVKEADCPYEIVNSCTIDGSIMVIYCLHKWFLSVRTFLQNEVDGGSETATNLQNVMNLVDARQFNSSKAIWLEKMCGLALKPKSHGVNNVFGNETEMTLVPLKNLFEKYTKTITCKLHGERVEGFCLFDIEGPTLVDKINRINKRMVVPSTDCCLGCTSKVTRKISVSKAGSLPFLVFLSYTEKFVSQVPPCLTILGKKYDLFCLSLHQSQKNHFLSVYPFGKQWFTYDGLNKSFIAGLPETYDKVNLVWYVRR